MSRAGRLVILNGAPRAGKSAIVAAMQALPGSAWLNLGVDVHVRAMTPPQLQPGIGLRPGGERPDLEPFVVAAYAALFDTLAAHARHGLDVVADLGIHDGYSLPRGILADGARRLAGTASLFVGVHCPLPVILARRAAGEAGREGLYLQAACGTVPEPVLRWQQAVHHQVVYDLALDTSVLSPQACAEAIATRLAQPATHPSALARLAAGTG